jgi:hypothetical protein
MWQAAWEATRPPKQNPTVPTRCGSTNGWAVRYETLSIIVH